MGFQAAFGATPTAPEAGAGGFSGAFGIGQTATPAPVNVALQRQTMPQPAKVASVSPWSVLTGIPAASGVIPALTTPLAPSSYNPAVAAKTNPLVVPETAWNTVKMAVTTAGNALADTYSSVPAAINGTGSKLQAATDVGTAGFDAISAIFSPISGALAGLAKMPVIGVAAGAVNNLFSALGAGGSAGATGLVDALPVSDATKAKILPLAQQAGALVAQIAVGKVGADSISLLKGNLSHIIDHVQADATTPESPQVTPQTTPESPQTTPNVPTPETPTTPVVPPTEPTASVTPTSPEPTIPVALTTPAETPQTPTPESTAPATPTTEAAAPTTAPVTPPSPIERPVTAEGETPAKSANDINESLVNKGIAKLSPDQMSIFTTGSYKDSAAQAEILKNTAPDKLMEMATTGQGIPAGVHPQILFNVAEAHAEEMFKTTKDPTQLMELAKSPLTTELSKGASTLGSHGYNDNPNSSTAALNRAAEAKAGGTVGKAKTEAAVKEAKVTITKTAAKMMDFNKIIDAINTC